MTNTASDATRAWRTLSTADLFLVGVVLLAQVVLGAALQVLSIRWLPRAVVGLRPLARLAIVATDDRVAWAIEAVGRRLPGISTCLVRALAADLFLGGTDATGIRVGVRRGPNGTLESHAWFERNGRILVGGGGADAYTQFITLSPYI